MPAALLSPTTHTVGDPEPERPAEVAPTPDDGRRSRRRGALVLLVLLALGLGLRLVELDRSPLAFHPARQYRSALLTHSYLLDDTRPGDDQERVNAVLAARLLGDLEPPVLERVTEAAYLVTGEDLVVPRLLGIAAWLGGAVACWSILGRRRDRIAQVVGTATLLVLPMGVAASRAFQPDALMVATALGAMALALRAEDERRPRLWAGALALAALAIFVEPMAGPMVLAWCAAVVGTSRGWRGLASRRIVGATAAVLAPTAVYYAANALAGKASGGWMGGSFLPRMFLEVDTYRMWWSTVDRAVPMALVLLVAVAVAASGRRDRILLGAAFAGYVAMMCMVNYRAATHDYYHLPLVGLTALGLGLGASDVARRVRSSSLDPGVQRAALAVGTATLALFALAFATGLRGLEADTGTARAQVAANEAIGELTGHSRHVLSLSRAYGADLAYEGDVVAVELPGEGDVQLLERRGLEVPTIAETIEDTGAEWLAVTNLSEWERQPALRAEMRRNHRLAGEGDGWMVWELSAP